MDDQTQALLAELALLVAELRAQIRGALTQVAQVGRENAELKAAAEAATSTRKTSSPLSTKGR